MLGSGGDLRRARGSQGHHQLRGGLSDLLGLNFGGLHVNEPSCREFEEELQKRDSEEDVSLRLTFSDSSELHEPEEGLRFSSDDLELIGRGAYGCVYKGVWEGRPAAIKVG
jgi:hypothetical protein